MTAIHKEADELIHLMRQSKMDDIRAEIEKIMKYRDRNNAEPQRQFIEDLKGLFERASKTIPT